MTWLVFSPELYYLAATALFLLISFLPQPNPKRQYLLALSLAVLGLLLCLGVVKQESSLFAKAYRVDLFSQVFKVMLAAGLFLVVCLCTELNGIRRRRHNELYLLLFLSTLAMMLLVSGAHFISIFLALELAGYSLYILVALRREWEMGLEAAMKYFLIGIFASAVTVFGMALLYAATGTMYLDDLVKIISGRPANPAIIIGLLLTLCGFFFKLAVFPFHFWAPDIYQGAPNQVATFVATASKVAAIAVLVRLVLLAGNGSIYLVHILVTLAIVSMTLGNLAAIAEKDLKRLLAYSTIAHAGYVLIGVLSMSSAGYAGAVFYAMSLLVMKFTIFLVVVQVAYDGGNLRIEQLAGLHRRSPLLAMTLMVAAFSLAGIPPTVGFTGKFLVFTAAMQQGHFTLVLIAMINVVISLYYYLLVIKAAYLAEPADDLPDLPTSLSVKSLSIAMVCLIVVMGIYPYPFMEFATNAVRSLM